MANNKIIRFPIRAVDRWRNRIGKWAIPCFVSDRWLRFPNKAENVGGQNYMFIDVMTHIAEKKERKLCSLCVSKEDLRRMLDLVEDGAK